jgi:hypothetical protein
MQIKEIIIKENDKEMYYILVFFLFLKGLVLAQEINIDLLDYSGDYVGDKPYWSTCTQDSNLLKRDTLIFFVNSPRCDDFLGFSFHNKEIKQVVGGSSKLPFKIIYSKRIGLNKRVKFYKKGKIWYLKLALDNKSSRIYQLVELSKKSLGFPKTDDEERFSYKMIVVHQR